MLLEGGVGELSIEAEDFLALGLALPSLPYVFRRLALVSAALWRFFHVRSRGDFAKAASGSGKRILWLPCDVSNA